MGRCAAMSEFLVSTFDQFLQHDNCVGKGNASRIWPGLLDTLYPNLKGVGQLSRKLALVCERAFAIRLRPHVKNLHFVEFWCGSGQLSQALLSFGFDGAGLDVNLSEEHNCLMSSGLRLWMDLLMSIVEHGLCWMGPPCSSFVILCLALSQRYDYNDWWGDTSREFVRRGNMHMQIAALFFLLACVLGLQVCLEQPSNSCMCQLPPMSSVLSFVRASKITTYLGAFGGPTQKPLQIWCTRGAYSQLIRQKPGHACDSGTSLVTRNDDGSFTGVKDLLVESGAYTREFGQHVSKIFAEELQAKQLASTAAA